MTSPSSITCTEQDSDYEDLLFRCSEEVLWTLCMGYTSQETCFIWIVPTTFLRTHSMLWRWTNRTTLRSHFFWINTYLGHCNNVTLCSLMTITFIAGISQIHLLSSLNWIIHYLGSKKTELNTDNKRGAIRVHWPLNRIMFTLILHNGILNRGKWFTSHQ